MATTSSFKLNTKIALLTKHAKAQIIEPVLQDSFAITLDSTDAFDTDQLGSFDNVVQRKLSAQETALKKAYLACELSGHDQGLGSEGSFNSFITGATINHEIIAFVDVKQNIEIIAFAEAFIGLRSIEAKNELELADKIQPFIEQFDKSQKWMLEQNGKYLKGLDFSELLKKIEAYPCVVEPDFRAMNCPARQSTIAQASQDLVRRLKSTCPNCDHVNFVEKFEPQNIRYLSCELCEGKTTKRAPLRIKCDACGYIAATANEVSTASAMYCTICNP